MAINIQIGTTSDDPRKVSKSYSLGSPISCTLRGDVDIENPELEVAANNAYITSNYAYIPAWNRYYFFSKAPTVSSAGRMILHLSEDYLETYKDNIKNSNMMIVRSSSGSACAAPDSSMPMRSKPWINVQPIPGAIPTINYDGSSNDLYNNYILITQ